MVTYIQRIRDCNLSELFSVYFQSLEEDRTARYSSLDTNEGMQLASQDFYQYLSQIFFRTPGALLAVYSVGGKYVTALRLEPFKDGYLLSGLETTPEYRRKGYARCLVNEIIAHCREMEIPVLYSHIHKHNAASRKLHVAAGFSVLRKDATLIDGTFSTQYETLCCYCNQGDTL